MKHVFLARLLLISIALCVFPIYSSFAQNEEDTWVFGASCKVSFDDDGPHVGKLRHFTQECITSISDAEGNLLFYSNGSQVFDSSGQRMPNGDQLIGGISSTQIAVVPNPASCTQYYLFTVEDHTSENHELRYSIIDMCLNGGLGDVVSGKKNIFLAQNMGEKLDVTGHADGMGDWLLSHRLGSSEFLAFRTSEDGLIKTPVISDVGGEHAEDANIGPLVFSHDGRRLAISNMFKNLCELYDFDNETGRVSDPVDLLEQVPINHIYGIEFSPDNELLYLSDDYAGCHVYQLNLTTFELKDLYEILHAHYATGALKLGPDGKIYVARNGENYLDVIEFPNEPGPGCNYIERGLPLATETMSMSGLPFTIDFGVTRTPPVIAFEMGWGQCDQSKALLRCSQVGCSIGNTWSNGSYEEVIEVGQSGMYWLKVDSKFGCKGTDSIFLVLDSSKEIMSDFMVPNAFSPNGDGINDLFELEVPPENVISFRVYNRWGEKLYEVTKGRATWDGSYLGEKVPKGVYFWIGEFDWCYRPREIRRGTVTVVR